MSLLDKLLTAQQGDELVAEVRRLATAFERIAACVEAVLRIPEAPAVPDKPLGPEAIGEYGQEPSEEDLDDMRAKLKEQGFSDRQIEEELVKSLFGRDDD